MQVVSKSKRTLCWLVADGPACWRAVLVALCGTLLCVLASAAPASAQRLSFQLYDQASGLGNEDVFALAQDRAGFLYAGTGNGLYRYDGFRFSKLGTREGLPASGPVEAVRAATGGGVWTVFPDRVYLSGSGATRSAPLEAPFDDHIAHRADVLGDDLLLVRNGHLLRIHSGPGQVLTVQPMLFGADHALDPYRTILAAGIDTVHVDHGEIWLGFGGTVCRLDAHGMLVLGAASGLPPDRWTALVRDHAGTLWVRSASRIASLPRGAARFTVIDVPGGAGRFASDPGSLEFVEDSAGHVVTQSAYGLAVHEFGHWVVFDRGESLSYVVATALLVDREGSLWIGSVGRGVARVIGLGLFETWTRAQGLSDDLIWNMRRDGAGTLWVADDLAVDPLAEHGGPGTLRRPDPERLPSAADPIRRDPIRAFSLAESPQGRLWIGRQDGSLIRRDPWTGLSQTMAHVAPIHVMASDPAGPLWIGTIKGVARIDRPDDVATPIVSGMMPFDGRIFAIRFDGAGEPWVLAEKTLFHRDGRQVWHAVMQTSPEGGYQTRTMAFAPDGTLWLGSFTTGITRLRVDHDRVVARDGEPTAHLASRDVEMMHRDAAGRVWIGTDHGLDVTDGTNWRHLDQQDGLAGDDTDENAAFTDADDTLWFGTTAGLSHLINTQGLFAAGHQHLHPVITRLSVGDRVRSMGQIQGTTVHLHGTGDPLVIGFSALDFKYASSIGFRYRLRGVDPGWVETSAHEVRYPNAPSGKLVFEVMAVDPLHRLGSEPARLTLKIRAPWWRSWLSYAAALLLVIALLVLLWRLRVSYLLERQYQLEALVRERTREIEEARRILFKQATFDGLTNLLNRAAILERLRLAMDHAKKTGAPLALALLDIDHFKKINDVFGHLGGDAVLAEVGRRLAAGTRDGDDSGRYGGEELLLVLPGLKQGRFERIESLRDAVFAAPFVFEANTVGMTCSMGVTWLRPGDDVTSMIRRADAALYAAKRNGRNRIVFDPPLPAWRAT